MQELERSDAGEKKRWGEIVAEMYTIIVQRRREGKEIVFTNFLLRLIDMLSSLQIKGISGRATE